VKYGEIGVIVTLVPLLFQCVVRVILIGDPVV